ncbi:hypothetical protein [Pseudomonas fluorescens]|uniref:Uncharacterized protein n=1 Tax=Pseudomonas fluorescens TaxID=294 RepID=A0A7Z6MZ25_PSEFL|nr:hypothetical protein [Pseudomonas fluorescens]RDS90984.1 hypothetical protein DL347_13135 [Pseudomonas fluorescens]
MKPKENVLHSRFTLRKMRAVLDQEDSTQEGYRLKPLDTHAPQRADTAVTRLKLKDQLAVDPYKALALLESTLLCFVTTALMLFVAHSVGITATFKVNVLYGGTLGACIGATYRMYHDAALSAWCMASPVSPAALQNAMRALKYSETQEGVYCPKKRMFTPFHRCDSERITLTTLDGGTRFTGPYFKLKALSAMQLADAPEAQETDLTPPTVHV